MKIYMLVKYNSVSEEIEGIYADEDNIITSGEIESLRNNYAMIKKDEMRWKIEVIDFDNIK